MAFLRSFFTRRVDLDPPVPGYAFREAVADLLNAEVRADAEALRADRAEAELDRLTEMRRVRDQRRRSKGRARVMAVQQAMATQQRGAGA